MRCLRCKQEIERSFRACPHCGEPVTEFVRRYTDELLDGKYRLLERLGTGGMGEVYKAEHTFLGATRVIKVIRSQISGSQDAHDRFLREARLATKVQHTNVATLHDFSALPDGSHYMVWEYIDGENIAQRLKARGPLPPAAAVRLIIQALHGLEAIHRAGIVHRDISPENLMIAREHDVVKIIDLGVAKLEDPSDTSATRTGIFVGKLRYAAPEQLGFLPESEKIDGRADIYATGMVLYEMLAGRPPYEATSPHQYYLMHSEEREFRPLELPPDLPGSSDLQAALRRALQRDRNKRFATAHEFADVLEAVARALPDPGAMKTMAIPADLDATMRVTPSPDTLHRSTVRTEARQAAAFVATAAPAAATVLTPLPAPPKPSSKPLFVILGVVALLFLAGAVALGAWWLARDRSPAPPIADSTATLPTATTSTEPAQRAESTVDVAAAIPSPTPTTTTTTEPTLAAPITTTTAPAPADTSSAPTTTTPRATPPPDLPRDTAPAPPSETAGDEAEPPAAEIPANTYVEHGDEDANERLLAKMQQELRGTTRIAVHGGGMQDELVQALRDEFPDVEIAASAPVVIEFEGLIEHKGRGRKTRYARAVIRKNGRPVFRYLMPTEIYRVGNTPVEAFVGKLEDAFSE